MYVSSLIPSCMEQIGEHTYRCKNSGKEITTHTLPIRNCCFCQTKLPPQQIAKPQQQSIQKSSYPSIPQMAKNFGKAVVDHVKDGLKNVEDEEYQRRLKICAGDKDAGIEPCEHFDANATRCRKCGCYLSLKAMWGSSHCPIGKW